MNEVNFFPWLAYHFSALYFCLMPTIQERNIMRATILLHRLFQKDLIIKMNILTELISQKIKKDIP